MIAVASLGCSRKINDIYSWSELMNLIGDYRVYFNWEVQAKPFNDDVFVPKTDYDLLEQCRRGCEIIYPDRIVDFDVWRWEQFGGKSWWRKHPKFDQDQARLSSIVMARNMAIEYAMQTECSHLLFIDADIVPPVDIIPKLLEVGEDSVGGLVHGRGVHSNSQYIFGEKRRWEQFGTTMVECEHGNIGFCMLSRKLFNQVRFRYGMTEYPDGRHQLVSDDPAYHLDAFMKFGKWHYIRLDVVGRHMGELLSDGVSQF